MFVSGINGLNKLRFGQDSDEKKPSVKITGGAPAVKNTGLAGILAAGKPPGVRASSKSVTSPIPGMPFHPTPIQRGDIVTDHNGELIVADRVVPLPLVLESPKGEKFSLTAVDGPSVGSAN